MLWLAEKYSNWNRIRLFYDSVLGLVYANWYKCEKIRFVALVFCDLNRELYFTDFRMINRHDSEYINIM